jgi:peroxiredoxin
MSVEEFMAKVKRTCEIFQRETPQGRTAAGVVLNKTCNAFNGKLTKEQYFDLLSNIQPLVDNEKNENLKSILAYSCYLIYKKSDAYEGDRDTDVTSAHTGTSEIITSQVSKTIVYNSMLMNEMVEKEMVDCQISGTAPLSGSKVEVRRSITSELLSSCPITNGKFSFACKLPKNEVCRIYLDNGEVVYFYTDGKPISADMEKLTVRSSKASQKVNDFLQLVERERLAELHEADSQKKAEINRQRGERLLKAVRENRDNILSAYALSQVYTEMSYEELKPYLSDDYAFSHHILLAPMREYVEGLEKRRPGTPYANLELMDTKGRPHQLSEYIGKGYVVLHFWHGLGGYGSEIHPSMKTLYDTYRSRGVEFVTLAFSFGVQRWREEVKQHQLPWPQLMPDLGTNPRTALAAYGIRSYPELIVIDAKGTIVACPRNVEELGSVLKKLHNQH